MVSCTCSDNVPYKEKRPPEPDLPIGFFKNELFMRYLLPTAVNESSSVCGYTEFFFLLFLFSKNVIDFNI